MMQEDIAHCMSEMTGKKMTWLDNTMVVVPDNDCRIYLEYMEESDELYLYSHVASIPQERFGRYAIYLLIANHFGKETGGSAVLAYDVDECQVVIWDRLPVSAVTADEFLERFCFLYLSKLHWTNKMRADLLGGDAVTADDRTAVFTTS